MDRGPPVGEASTAGPAAGPAAGPRPAGPPGLDALLERCRRATGVPLRVWWRSGGRPRLLHDSLARAGGTPGATARLDVPAAGDRERLEVEYPEGVRGAREAAELAGDVAGRLLSCHRELRLFSHELVDCYEQIHLLTSIGDVLGSVIQVEPAVRTILGDLVSVLGGGRATLWRGDGDVGALSPFVCRGRCGPAGGEPSTASERRLAERAFGRQEPLLVSAGDGATGVDSRARAGDRLSILSVPVTFAPRDGPQRRIGVLSVAREGAAPPFTAGDLRLAEAVASQIGIAIQNGRLVQEGLQRERMLAELDLAHDLQLKLLPSLDGFSDLAEVAARCEPVHQVGGDFYLLIRLHAGRLGVMLGDVSSHGFSAALIMALTMSAAAIYAREQEEPGEVLRRIHLQLLRELESTEMYMTLFYGVLDRSAGRLTYANAGHPFAYRVDGGGARRLDALDPPVGITRPAGYRQASLEWGPGRDLLLLCTDGLAAGLGATAREAEGALARVAAAAGPRGPGAVVEALFGLAAERPQDDDRSALVVRL